MFLVYLYRRVDPQQLVEVLSCNGWELDKGALGLLPQALKSAWSCMKVRVCS